MWQRLAAVLLLGIAEVAGAQAGRFFKMDGPHRWVAVNFTLGNLIALAYDLSPKTISGGPGWMDSQHFNIEAVTPGDVAPTRLEQMQMLRALLVDYGAWYLITLGGIAVVVMLFAPRGLWGLLAGRFDLHLFPVQRRVRLVEPTGPV